ncbi:hypothetical protein WJX84_008067 [Apatococcus fuscideae]|uniref:Uncharacterized protein n=1 Tax=Apatococcus fuscideae TaxID=2026836 RepID=A0AAW1S9S0_9CHLO
MYLKVARNSIWRERCKKESSCRKLNLNFSIPNPDRMVILPLKPNNTVPVVSKLSPQQLLEVTADLARVCNTQHTHRMHGQPHLPTTANAAYGLSTEPLYHGHPMFHHPKTNTNVTAYAEAYAASMGGQNPFARHPLGAGK